MKDSGLTESDGDEDNLLNVKDAVSLREYFNQIDQDGWIEEEPKDLVVNSDSDDDGIMYPTVDPKDWA